MHAPVSSYVSPRSLFDDLFRTSRSKDDACAPSMAALDVGGGGAEKEIVDQICICNCSRVYQALLIPRILHTYALCPPATIALTISESAKSRIAPWICSFLHWKVTTDYSLWACRHGHMTAILVRSLDGRGCLLALPCHQAVRPSRQDISAHHVSIPGALIPRSTEKLRRPGFVTSNSTVQRST